MVSICSYPIKLVIVQIYNNIETKIVHYFIWFCMNQSYNIIWHVTYMRIYNHKPIGENSKYNNGRVIFLSCLNSSVG